MINLVRLPLARLASSSPSLIARAMRALPTCRILDHANSLVAIGRSSILSTSELQKHGWLQYRKLDGYYEVPTTVLDEIFASPEVWEDVYQDVEPSLEWLTTGKAAAILNVSNQTVRRWRESGKLRGRRIGGWWQISPKSVAEVVAERGSTSGESRGTNDNREQSSATSRLASPRNP